MSTLRPIGVQPASFPAKTTQTRNTQPQFAGGGQSTQRSGDEQQPIVQRRIPIPKKSYKTLARQGFREGLSLIVLAPIAMVVLPLVMLVSKVPPLFPGAQKKLDQKVTKTIETIKAMGHNPEDPQTKRTANHELGHALAALSAGVPMEALMMMKMFGMNGCVACTSDAPTGKESPAAFYKRLITAMAGHGADLNRATPDELKDEKFISKSRMHAGGDVANVIPLIQHAQKQGWVKLTPTQIPQAIDLKRYKQLASKAKRTQAETQEVQKLLKQIDVFFNLPIVQEALKAAREIHAVIPTEKRENMVGRISKENVLEQEELYDLLETLSDDELKRIQTIQERFIEEQESTIPPLRLRRKPRNKLCRPYC